MNGTMEGAKMQIKTKRFGNIEAGDEHFISFRDGMIGMSALKKYILVESPAYPLMLWLQSCEDAGIAFPVIEPNFFKTNYKLQMTDADRACLKFEEGHRIKEFVVLTIPENVEDMTANLRAPVVINLANGTGNQVVLQDKELQIRRPVYKEFINILNSIADSSDEILSEVWSPVSIRNKEQTALLEATV
jgi:flagellar assembly factor FliW